MRIATWNVNSIRARLPRVIDWLASARVDVLALQEIKCRPEQFPGAAFEALGYHVSIWGTNQWNGVALITREPATDVQAGFSGAPAWGVPPAVEPRALGGTVRGVRVWSLYVPNGRSVDDPHYRYKLAWLGRLAHEARSWLAEEPDAQIALVGDWNVAPRDEDVWDIRAFAGETPVTPAEREAFGAFAAQGYRDVVRPLAPTGYTFWDYKHGRYPRDEGMRIDFVLGSPALAARVEDAFIDRAARSGEKPSDHVPVVVQLREEDSAEQWDDWGEDDRPMVL